MFDCFANVKLAVVNFFEKRHPLFYFEQSSRKRELINVKDWEIDFHMFYFY
jgi:hypothetical protein